MTCIHFYKAGSKVFLSARSGGSSGQYGKNTTLFPSNTKRKRLLNGIQQAFSPLRGLCAHSSPLLVYSQPKSQEAMDGPANQVAQGVLQLLQ